MRQTPTRRLLRTALLVVLGQAMPACAQDTGLLLSGTGQGQFGFASNDIHELSGITYLGGDSFIVVSDTNGTMAPATIVIDRATGQITSASIGTPVPVSGGNDLEGVAYDPRDGSVLVSDESGNTITRHQPANGTQTGSITVPSIFASARGNLGLESLSLDPVGFDLWTANEESLSVDGPRATASVGTIVRLQRFGSDGSPLAQFAHLTQPHSGGSTVPPQSGVSGLVALPGGGLIVMERELGGSPLPTLRNRFYLIDTSAATDTSDAASLSGVTTGLVETELLLQVSAGFSNFEGVALGPMLDNGDYALVMVSDDGGSGFNPQNLLTLRLSGIAVEGDLTGDFLVDEDDLAVVLGAWGVTVTAGNRLAGDPSGDGVVGIRDLDTVLANWSAPTPPAVNVPEPSGVASLAAGSLVLLGWRW